VLITIKTTITCYFVGTTIAALLEKDAANFVAQNFFAEFRRDVVGEGNFLWHRHFKKRCRMLAVLNLGEFNEILKRELAGDFCEDRCVYLDGTKDNAVTLIKHKTQPFLCNI
jgi:hypothetical protein